MTVGGSDVPGGCCRASVVVVPMALVPMLMLLVVTVMISCDDMVWVEGRRGWGREEILYVRYHSHRLLSFALHETFRTRADNSVKDLQKLHAFPHSFSKPLELQKSRGHVFFDFGILDLFCGKVDEESTAHVRL